MKLDRVHIAKGFVERLDAVGAKKACNELAALLLEHRMHSELEELLVDIEWEYNRQHGTIEATAHTAFPLSSELRAALSERVKNDTGANKVILHEEIDASLLGGVVIDAPDVQLDLSLKTKLSRLRA